MRDLPLAKIRRLYEMRPDTKTPLLLASHGTAFAYALNVRPPNCRGRDFKMPYQNPVYQKSFPDPFVLKWWNGYWGYSTGFQPDGGVFGVLYSHDLIHWQYIGSAMMPIEGGHPCYWAPEVTYDNGMFFLYYSVGNEETMHIRLARSSKPEGPFEDAGVQLTNEPFAIDPHVFIDDDGKRYMFYATDFLTHTHIGTGTVIDRMLNEHTLEGKPEPVTRARYEWQVYDPVRTSKGGVKWHTVEGPFVVKRKGLYYEMFSGGNWQNLTYGVSYARSDNIKPGHEWEQYADGAKVLPILRTIPGKVIGPGHNSVIRGPDNREIFCIYHLWHEGERVLAIDRMDWIGSDLLVRGPTTGLEADPNQPRRIGGEVGTESVLEESTPRTIEIGSSALVQFWCKRSSGSWLKIELHGEAGTVFKYNMDQRETRDEAWEKVTLDLDIRDFHCNIGNARHHDVLLSHAPKLTLIACDGPVALSPIEITRGWEELFESDSLVEGGWDVAGNWEVRNKELTIDGTKRVSHIAKDLFGIDNYEAAINWRSVSDDGSIMFLFGEKPEELAIAIDLQMETITLMNNGKEVRSIAWPERFDRKHYQQLLVKKMGDLITIEMSGTPCFSEIPAHTHQRISIHTTGTIALDMVRLKELVA